MDEQLKALIDKAIDAGYSDEDIQGLVEEHKLRNPQPQGEIRASSPGLIERGLNAMDDMGPVPGFIAGAARRGVVGPLQSLAEGLKGNVTTTSLPGMFVSAMGVDSPTRRIPTEATNPDEALGAGASDIAAVATLPNAAPLVGGGIRAAARGAGKLLDSRHGKMILPQNNDATVLGVLGRYRKEIAERLLRAAPDVDPMAARMSQTPSQGMPPRISFDETPVRPTPTGTLIEDNLIPIEPELEFQGAGTGAAYRGRPYRVPTGPELSESRGASARMIEGMRQPSANAGGQLSTQSMDDAIRQALAERMAADDFGGVPMRSSDDFPLSHPKGGTARPDAPRVSVERSGGAARVEPLTVDPANRGGSLTKPMASHDPVEPVIDDALDRIQRPSTEVPQTFPGGDAVTVPPRGVSVTRRQGAAHVRMKPEKKAKKPPALDVSRMSAAPAAEAAPAAAVPATPSDTLRNALMERLSSGSIDWRTTDAVPIDAMRRAQGAPGGSIIEAGESIPGLGDALAEAVKTGDASAIERLAKALRQRKHITEGTRTR